LGLVAELRIKKARALRGKLVLMALPAGALERDGEMWLFNAHIPEWQAVNRPGFVGGSNFQI
jgi:hypothetical protein